MHVFFCIAVEDTVMTRGDCDYINWFNNQLYFCSSQKPEPAFPSVYVNFVILFNSFRSELVVRFVDIGGILFVIV